jgi:hypothetical protein
VSLSTGDRLKFKTTSFALAALPNAYQALRLRTLLFVLYLSVTQKEGALPPGELFE